MSLDNTPQPSVKYCADKVNARYTSPASLSAMVWALSKRLVAPPQFCEGAGIKALLQKRIDPPGEPDTDLANDIWHRDLNLPRLSRARRILDRTACAHCTAARLRPEGARVVHAGADVKAAGKGPGSLASILNRTL